LLKSSLDGDSFSVNVNMYRLGDKFDVPSLCILAKMKFEASATTLWSLTSRPKGNQNTYEDGDSITKFIEAVRLAYSSIPDTNHGMRDSMALAALNHLHHLMALKDFQALVHNELPDFSSDILMTLCKRSKLEDQSCRHCQTCGDYDSMPHTFIVARACGTCLARL
jgi:hypothetical protein